MREGRSIFCASLVLRLYQLLASETIRRRLRKTVVRLEGGPANSLTIREIFRRFYRVDVGLYTPGPCGMKPTMFHQGTSIGRYASVAPTVRTFTRNHPMNLRSTHALFYNPSMGVARCGPVQFGRLVIGHGAVIGHNAIIVPPTERIGDGAYVTPGSVVCTNVPAYAIVSGFPARVTGYRFDQETTALLTESKWWERTPSELLACGDDFHGVLLGSDNAPDRHAADLPSALWK